MRADLVGWPYQDPGADPEWTAGDDSWPAGGASPGWPYGQDHPSWPAGSDHPNWPRDGGSGCEGGAPMSRSAVPSDRARLLSVLQRSAVARQVVGGPALAGPGHDRAESQHDWVTSRGSHGRL